MCEIKDTLHYRELISVFVKRYFSTLYKQTILGPAWIIINPLVTTLVFSVIFGNVAQLSTEGLPKPLFYMGEHDVAPVFDDCFAEFIDLHNQLRDFQQSVLSTTGYAVATAIQTFLYI